MNTAANRQTVQEGLDRRAAERRDAVLEAQARKLRLIINDNHTAKTTYKIPAQRPECPQEEPKKATVNQSRRAEEKAERAAEAAYCNAWYSCLLRSLTPMVIAAATLGLSVRGMLPFQLTIPCAIFSCMLGLANFAERYLHVERD